MRHIDIACDKSNTSVCGMMRAGWDLQVNSGDSSSSEDESVSASSDEGTAETVSYLDMLLKESPSPENNERDHVSEDSFNRVQTPVESGAEASSKNEGYEENDHYSGNGKTPKNNNLGFWDDAEMTFTSFEEEMVALESFLNCHHKKRLSSRSSSSQKEVRKDVEIDTEDYVNYMRLNSSSSNAIRQTFLYCLRTDDIKLADLLLRDVGIEFILRHCMLYDGVFNDGSSSSTPDLSGSTATENRKTSTANLFWLAALHGADGVLNMIAEQCLVYFIEAYTGGCEESEEVVEKAKDDFATILNNNVSVSDCLPLYVAAAKNHASVIRTLLKFGTNPNDTCQGKKSAAIIAASNNNLLALQALGESEKIDFNWADEKSLTPMLAACRNGCVDAVRFLTHYSGNETQQSVNCSRQDLKGYGCASLAARYNHQEVVIFLSHVHNPDSKVGIDINQRNRYSDEIALHVAAEYNCREVVRSLLEMIPCYCDVGARNQHHMTALHIAASHGHVGIVTEFVSSVSTELISELDTHDQFGMTPLFYGECLA